MRSARPSDSCLAGTVNWLRPFTPCSDRRRQRLSLHLVRLLHNTVLTYLQYNLQYTVLVHMWRKSFLLRACLTIDNIYFPLCSWGLRRRPWFLRRLPPPRIRGSWHGRRLSHQDCRHQMRGKYTVLKVFTCRRYFWWWNHSTYIEGENERQSGLILDRPEGHFGGLRGTVRSSPCAGDEGRNIGRLHEDVAETHEWKVNR